MAFNAPNISLPDNSGFSNYIVYSSNIKEHFIYGNVDPNTIDVQVQIRGGGFVSDSTLVALDLPNFIIPNQSNYPNGITLIPGVNQIDIRAIDVNGNVSPISSVLITYVTDKELSLQISQPTGLQIYRHRDEITLTIIGDGNENIVGYNVYASKESGGISTGYFKLNKSIISEYVNEFEDLQVSNEQIVYSHSDGNLHILLTEEDNDGSVQRVISDSVIPLVNTPSSQITSISVVGKNTLPTYSFTHNRLSTEDDGITNNEQFIDVTDDQPLYYVVTAIGYDSRNREYLESKYSSELVGVPLIIDSTIKDMVPISRQDIILDEIKSIQRVNPSVSLIPGSSTRDIHIDPPASELERLAFISDFIHRSQSFLTLMEIDDANHDGISDPVATSPYKLALKSALFIVDNDDVQYLIDDAFDKLAGNYNTPRKGAQKSIGQEVFYTTKKPTKTLTAERGAIVSTTSNTDLGIPSVSYEVTSQVSMQITNIDSYYVPSRRRWEITANIRALDTGLAGNRPANQIDKVTSGAAGLSVINLEPTQYGYDIESNSLLAERAMLALSSVDSGTKGGYLASSISVSGIQESLVIYAGHPLMMRDWDEVRKKHIGGKVDIWIKGLNEQEVTDTFSFSFDIVQNKRFEIIDSTNFIFRSLDSNLTENNPLVEMLDDPIKGYGFRNTTKGYDFDLTDVVIVDYRTIQLSSLVSQPSFDFDDIIVGDYRYQSSNYYIPIRQPLRRVISIIGEVSGTLDFEHGYSLFKLDDPLLYGESVKSNDYIAIYPYNGIPSGASIIVNDEIHILVGTRSELLRSIGVDLTSIRVFNSTRTIEYSGPESSNPDYLIIPGTTNTAASIVRVQGGSIFNGQQVSIDYEHDENFTVRYVVNDLIRIVQEKIDSKKHITADVLVKQAIENSITIENTVVLNSGSDRALADSKIRTGVSNEVSSRKIGGGIHQSDIVKIYEETPGVDYVILPFSTMIWSDSSQMIRDELLSDYIELPSLHSGSNKAYILITALSSNTIDGGGYENQHRGVFKDGQIITLVTNLETICDEYDRAYIIGKNGAIIVGYSDDATLIADGFIEDVDIAQERLNRTSNRIVLSLEFDPNMVMPDDHTWTCSYIVYGDTGARDLNANKLEALTLGDFNIIYSEG